MITKVLRRSFLTGLTLCGALAASALSAAPNFPDLYIDPDDVGSDVEEPRYAVWPGGLAAFADRPEEVFDGRGVVGSVQPEGPWVYINGQRFGFSLDPDIRLRAGVGAPTLLTEGMALEYYFSPAQSGERVVGRIVAAIELEPGAISLQ